MDRVRIGRSGLVSSVLGLGGGSSGRFGLVKGTRSDALRLIHTALDLGIDLFDGAGLSGGVDELLAEGLGERRANVVLSTKVHLGPEPHLVAQLPNQASAWVAKRTGWVCSGAAIRRRVELTLRALRTDWIDILHLHAVTPTQYPKAVGRVLPELLKLVEEGKLRAIGLTEGFLSDPGHQMLQSAVRHAHFDIIMAGFNVINRSAATTIFPTAHRADLGVIGMFVFRGVGAPGSTKPMRELLEEAGAGSLADLAYRYARHQAGMHVVLTGTGDAAHLRRNVAAVMAPPLPANVIDRLEKMSGAAQAGGAATRK